MEWPIKVDLGKGYFVDASLTMNASSDEVLIGCVNPLMKEALVLDKFSSFDRIEFDDTNPLHVRFIGESATRSFKFEKEDAVSEVWMFLQKVFKFVSIPGKCRAFSIVRKCEKPSLISYLTGRKCHDKSADYGKRVPEAMSSGIVRQSMSELDLTVVDQDNIEKVFVGGSWVVPVDQIEVKDGFEFDMWMKIMKVDVSEKRKESFHKIEDLWKNIQRCQWERHAKLREFVHLVESTVEADETMDKTRGSLVFHVCVSIFMWNYSEFAMSDSFLEFVMFLVKYLVASSDGGDIICRNGYKLPMVDASFLVFSLFTSIYDGLVARVLKDNAMTQIYNDTIELLEEQSPASIQLLSESNVVDFDFLKPCLDSFFTKGRTDEEAVIMFTVMISARDINMFLKCFISAALVLLHARLVESAPRSQNSFGELFISLLPSVDVRLLICNSTRLMDLCLMESQA